MSNVVEVMERVCAGLESRGVKCFVGSQHAGRNDPPPRIIIVPTGDKFNHSTGRQISTGARSFMTRVSNLQVSIWEKSAGGGDGYAPVEELLRKFLEALHDNLAPGNYIVEGGQWADVEGDAVSQLGRVYLLSVSVLIPVLRTTPTLSVATIDVLERQGFAGSGAGEVLVDSSQETEP